MLQFYSKSGGKLLREFRKDFIRINLLPQRLIGSFISLFSKGAPFPSSKTVHEKKTIDSQLGREKFFMAFLSFNFEYRRKSANALFEFELYVFHSFETKSQSIMAVNNDV